MRIDAHHHLWDLAVTPQTWLTPDLAAIDRSFLPADLVAAAGSLVDGTVLVQTVTDAAETPVLLEYAAETELISGVVGWVDLTAPDVADLLAALLEGPHGDQLVGIRHQVQGEPDPQWLCRDDVQRGLAAVGHAGLAYDLLTLVPQLPAAVEAVRRLPGVSFVLDHMSKPAIAGGALEPWRSDLLALAAMPNVTCKLSGMVTEAAAGWTIADLRPYADVVLDAFGPERVMFGSDWPVCLLATPDYGAVVDVCEQLTAGLSASEREAVWSSTAVRAYGLTRSS